MAEEFSGLGSTLYIGLPGQPFEEMHEVKISKTVPSLVPSIEEPCEWKDEQKELRGHPKPGWEMTFDVGLGNPACKALREYEHHSLRTCKEFTKVSAEAGKLIASWLSGGRCIARYNRLRRHYNRWRHSYSTRHTFYTLPFNKFLYDFMVHYVAMRNYHSENK